MRPILFSDFAIEKNGLMDEFVREKRWKKHSLSAEITLWRLEDGQGDASCINLICSSVAGLDPSQYECVRHTLSDELAQMIRRSNAKGERRSILAVGLGNSALAADSLGERTVRRVRIGTVEETREGIARLFSFVPDVVGNTGIESVQLVEGVARQIGADVILAVDSLSAKTCDRIGAAIQIANVGIHPGSGTGKSLGELSESRLGIPVISLGIPTAVNASALIAEILSRLQIECQGNRLRDLTEAGRSLFVIPETVDLIVEYGAILLADVIDRAVRAGEL